MRKTILFFIIICLSMLFACSSAQSTSSKKVLIVYLSRTGNTKAIAEIIQKNVGGTLVEPELQKPILKITNKQFNR